MTSLSKRDVLKLVDVVLEKKEIYLDLFKKYGSPLYIYEPENLKQRISSFKKAFAEYLPNFKVFYAMKSNNSPLVAKSVVENGLGLDVSSGVELQTALDVGAKNIIFSGPAKTETEHLLAIDNKDKVTILLDSFSELKRLNKLVAQKNVKLEVGLRLTPNKKGLWRKFGIPLKKVLSFIAEIQKYPNIKLIGFQFHSSWNKSPKIQVKFIKKLGGFLAQLDRTFLDQLRFLDIGGGYWPESGEWLFKNNPFRRKNEASVDIDIFAKELAGVIKGFIFPHIHNCQIYMEPGRWLSHTSMQIMLQVIDKKEDKIVITDGGTNTVGWEIYELNYFPVINLTRPARKECRCMILGSLCTPHDVWGYAYFGEAIQEGDVLLIPNQGAYTYSLRQNFIKPIAEVVSL